jgi:hypothetical protein
LIQYGNRKIIVETHQSWRLEDTRANDNFVPNSNQLSLQ